MSAPLVLSMKAFACVLFHTVLCACFFFVHIARANSVEMSKLKSFSTRDLFTHTSQWLMLSKCYEGKKTRWSVVLQTGQNAIMPNCSATMYIADTYQTGVYVN